MVVTLLLFFAVLLLLLALYVKHAIRWKNPPPGPYVHPLVGSMPTLSKLDPVPHLGFHTLTEMFGPVVRIVIGVQNMLVLGGFEEMKEAMNNELLDDRSPSGTANLIVFDDIKSRAISFFGRSEDQTLDKAEQWRELRRFTLKSLRDLGFGKAASEEAILEETTLLIENTHKQIKVHDGKVCLDKNLSCAALNVIWNLMASQRFEYQDENMEKLLDYSNAFMLMGKDVVGKPFGTMPFLRFFPPFRNKFNTIYSGIKKLKAFLQSAIDERKSLMVSGDPECYIDTFLDKITEDKSGIFTETQLIHCCLDVFVAGSETTNKTQGYAIAMMMHRPDIQRKVQEELDRVADGRSLVTLKDKDDLPYTEATFNECWRYCNIAPFGPPREGLVDVKLGDYTIPAGTQVMYNTYSMHMDRDIWGDPQEFRPERFIDDGKFKPSDRLFPFGIGRRRCLGETLARMENFLFFANLMLNFTFSNVGEEPPSLEPDPGFTNGPFPYFSKIQSRL